MPDPKDVKAVQTFLGLVNYMARFIPNLADIAAPLRQLTAKDAMWMWELSQEEAMKKIKNAIVQSTMLRYYDPAKPAVLQCDASEYGLGTALLEGGQPIAFASRTLSDTEKRYAQIEKECLAIVFACEKFQYYILGKESVCVESDHKPLEAIFKKSLLAAPKRLQRMLLRLQRFDLSVRYKPGADMYIADHLSRSPLPSDCTSQDSADPVYAELEAVNQANFLNVTPTRYEQIQSATDKDAALQAVIQVVLKGWPAQRDNVAPAAREYWPFRDEMSVQDGVLYKGCRVVIPSLLRQEMLGRIHYAHLGVEACLRRARETLYWPGMTG